MTNSSLVVGSTAIQPSSVVHNLGVLFDSELTFKQHVSKIVSSCFYQLRRLRQLKRHVDVNTMKLLISAFILSRLDYCNVLLSGLPISTVRPLQRVQNAALHDLLSVYHLATMSPLRWRNYIGYLSGCHPQDTIQVSTDDVSSAQSPVPWLHE